MTATGTVDRSAEDIWPPESARPRWERWWDWVGRKVKLEGVVTFIVVAASVVFVFKQLQPSQLFKNTTPAGGDMGAHVWLPDYVKRALLPHWRITGWTPDWYDRTAMATIGSGK